MRNKSFTLIELLVVIVIIGILAGVIIVSTSSSINKANFAKAQAFSNTVQQELLLNLVSEWTFDSPAVSGKTEDSWGNNDGTLKGANGLPQLQTKENCVYGTCYLFDGTDDYIDCGKNPVFNFGSNDFLISGWFKTNNSTTKQHLMGFGQSSSPNLQFDMNDGIYKIWVYWNGSGTPSTRTTMNYSDDKWHFIVFTRELNNFKLIVDGSIKTTTSNTSLLDLSNLNFVLGAGWPSAYSFNGLIDDVRIYNAALTTAQIKQEYIAGLNSLLANGNISKEEYDQRLNNLASK